MPRESKTPRRRVLIQAALVTAIALIGGSFCMAAADVGAAQGAAATVELVSLSTLMWILPVLLIGAVTANQLIKRQDGCLGNYPVAASTTIYGGTLVFVTGAGYADDDTATGANKFGGISREKVDNSSGSAGDLYVDVEREGIFELEGSGFTQADVGRVAYATDNYTVTTSYAAAAVRIGRVEEYVSATKIRVAIETDENDGLEYAALAASAEVENTTTETAFDKAHTIPANTLRPGDVIRVRAQATVIDNNSTDTLNLILRLGTTDILATGAVDVADNGVGFIDADIVIRTVGASGTMVAAGNVGLGAAGTATALPKALAETAIDTTADISVNVSATWSVAHADNEVQLEILNVEILRKR